MSTHSLAALLGVQGMNAPGRQLARGCEVSKKKRQVSATAALPSACGCGSACTASTTQLPAQTAEEPRGSQMPSSPRVVSGLGSLPCSLPPFFVAILAGKAGDSEQAPRLGTCPPGRPPERRAMRTACLVRARLAESGAGEAGVPRLRPQSVPPGATSRGTRTCCRGTGGGSGSWTPSQGERRELGDPGAEAAARARGKAGWAAG